MTKKPTTRTPKVLELHEVDLEAEAPPFDGAKDDVEHEPSHPPDRSKWFGLFVSGLAGLALLGLGLWAETLITQLLQRYPPVGWLAVSLLAVALIGFIGLIARELRAVLRLSAIDTLRYQTQAAYDASNLVAARQTIDQIERLYRPYPRTAQGRSKFAQQRVGVMDAQDLLEIGEDTLMQQLDRDAVAAVSSAARRVSLVTALSPRALIDIAMVLFQCLTLTRQIAGLYGARPGLLGALKLGRHMLAHLAVTGGMAATEGLVSQVLGHSLAARLSARLGEGVINGLLTARIGLAAIAVTRPMPFLSEPGPTLADVTKGIAGLGGPAPDNE